jgi:H+-translocating diphosphatase
MEVSSQTENVLAHQCFIIGSSVLSLAFGAYNVNKIFKVKLLTEDDERKDIKNNEEGNSNQRNVELKMIQMSRLIQDGATTFLRREYFYTGLCIIMFGVAIQVLVEPYYGCFLTTGPFLLGALTSIVSGYLAMQIAVRANVRTAIQAQNSLAEAFDVAFRGGLVLGFVLVGLGLLLLDLLIVLYIGKRETFFPESESGDSKTIDSYIKLFEAVAGYGLGGSTVALFGRVGGGIYTKAADVGADLVGKVIEDLDEDDLRNPGVIADNVGDNVGDVAGMGSDLFGSFAEATCACLVLQA